MESREEMLSYIKQQFSYGWFIKAQLCKRMDLSLPTINRVLAGHPKVRIMTIAHIYQFLKNME